MSRLKLFVCVFGALVAFLVGYGAASKAYPAGGVHGRGQFNGYRTNIDDNSGTHVLRAVYWGEAIRPNVEGDVDEFISFILNTKLDLDGNGSADGQDKRGATFIIHTMIGAPVAERYNRPTAAQIAEWERRVRYANSRGWITWRTNYAFTINSMFQGTNGGSNPDDDAFYDDNDSKASILFRNAAGTVVYALKWECANPVGTGNLGPIPDDVVNFSTSATIVSSVNGAVSSTAEAGDTITFQYTARNNGPAQPPAITCSTWRHNYTGYKVPPAWIEAGASPGPAMGCPPTLASGASRVITETVTATANSTICRFLQVTPGNQAGGAARDVACVTVYSKPYFRVYGGDVESGASFTPCAAALPADQGTIQAFNRGAAANYAGSGAEGAVMAYRTVTEFVSASMRAAAPRTPIGLTFANNSPASSPYGGNFGAGSCIPDYWSLSSSAGAVVNNPGAGSYTVPNMSLGPGTKQDIFVDGDAFITGNIVYTGTWTLNTAANNIPSLRLIVRGNIYIRDTVTQLDGVYVALPRPDGTKGLIYTCSLAAAPPTELQVASGCKLQLRVNGAFIAQGVKLLRTPNSVNNAAANETAAASRAGEIFTYIPEIWLANPQFRFPSTSDYDAITTLPPVL